MKLQHAVAIVALNFAKIGLGAAPSSTILESAILNPTNSGSAYTLFDVQYAGCRFHVSKPTLVDHIGGDLTDGSSDDKTIFGAIASLSSPNGFPSMSPSQFQPLAVTTFTVIPTNGDQLVPLSVFLPPGDYALIFGSGRFGATGAAGIRNRNIETSQASFFKGDFASTLAPTWKTEPTFRNLRFLVTGTPIPEPPTSILFCVVFLAIAAIRRKSTAPAAMY